LRKEHGLRVFENRALTSVFGPKRDEVTEDWRKLHNEELHNVYSSLNIIRIIKSRLTARIEEMRNAYKILIGNYEGKGQFGRPRR
jgi:hypothetical protein